MGLNNCTKKLLETNYTEVSTRFDAAQGLLWTLVDHTDVPCFTEKLLLELLHHHQSIQNSEGQINVSGDIHQIHYSVIASLTPKVFNLGGQLSLFRELIRTRNKLKLLQYATQCIKTIAPRINHFNSSITTIALVQGDALGGGLEAALTSDIVIAERGSLMGFPEVLFNLFPGMGAYSLVSRKIGASKAEKMILSGKMYKAEELHEMGLVDILAEPGAGQDAVYSYIKKQERRNNSFLAMQKVKRRCDPISFEELMDITLIWVDAALNLKEKDLRVMDYFVSAQEQNFVKHQQQPQQLNAA